MKRKLYEFTAVATCSVVVAAASEEEARAAISTWERAWFETGELVGISDVDLFEVRAAHSQDERSLQDEAHEIV